jgi:phosphoesterase RecJ-like protein
MQIAEEAVQGAANAMQSAKRVLVVSHIRPDGDAIGSLLGLGLALEAAGKQVQMVSEDGVPAGCRRLEGAGRVLHRPEGEFDLVCVVDCSDLERTGSTLLGRGQPDLNIDHHVTNLLFARHNLVEAGAVATAEIIFDLLPAFQLSLSTPVASALLTGLITDTIGFRTSNMTPRAMRLAATLMEAGADLPQLYLDALAHRSYAAVRLWGAGLSRVEQQDGLVWTVLTLQDRQATRYPGRDDADLINILGAVDGAEIAIIFLEQPDGRVKVSWRARPGLDVSQLAVRFGGGGHPAAAGAEIKGSLSDVEKMILEQTRPLLEINGGNRVQQ